MQVTTIGINLAKNIFQVHGVDAGGAIVIRKRLGRSKCAVIFREPVSLVWKHVRQPITGLVSCSR